MKTRKLRKFLMLLASALLLVSVTVGATVAYLTAEDTVVNTFTVGDVAITLDEAKVGTDGKALTGDAAQRVKANSYKLLPGMTYDKDPTVTVKANSEDTYVRIKVTVSAIDKLKEAFPAADYPTFYDGDLFLLQALVDGWDANNWPCKSYANGTYEFWYKGVVTSSTTDTVLDDLFETITIPGTVDNAKLEKLSGVTITAKAEAIQAAGFASPEQAWEAFPAN